VSANELDDGAHIVLVEDHPDAAESLVLLLELLGHRVRVFHEGVSALQAAHAEPPDVMVVDIGLPGIDGYEVARRARRDPALRDAVLVALTGHGRDDDKRAAAAAGFDHHLVKPIEPSALERLVERLAKRAHAAIH
jgi:two-component system CheB/CheR fusion protein